MRRVGALLPRSGLTLARLCSQRQGDDSSPPAGPFGSDGYIRSQSRGEPDRSTRAPPSYYRDDNYPPRRDNYPPRRESYSRGGEGVQEGDGDTTVVKEAYCPPDKVGFIIGRGGTNVRYLEDAYRVKIDIQDRMDEHGNKLILIHGSESDTAECNREITRLMAKARGKAGGYGHQDRSQDW